MAPDFYFFTDTNLISHSTLLSAEADSHAFGPAGTVDGEDQYRISSLHTASSNPMAHAICDGIVFVQRVPTPPTTSGTPPKLLNLILKPLVQPGLNFAPLKCFIYKGIREDSLLNGPNVAARTTNDLTKALWEAQDKKNAAAKPPTPDAAPSAVALDAGVTDTLPGFTNADPFDSLLYPDLVAAMPVVKGGSSIGRFDMNGFGLEILLEGLGFDHRLSLARTLEDTISVVPAENGVDPPKKTFEHWHDKEQVLGYMDPCAFYGSFFRAGVLARPSETAPFVRKSGKALYDGVLVVFANKNVVYLDIRNEHNFSFNYFANYGNDIQFSGDPGNAAPATLDYYQSLWPILTLDASSFPADNTTRARNVFQIQLPVGDNPGPLLYVSQGYRDIHRSRRGFPEELKGAERFYDAFEPPTGAFTKTRDRSGHTSMTFAVPNVTGLSATTPVSCYIRLKYLKREQGTTSSPTVIQSSGYLDNLWYPLDLRILFPGFKKIKSFVFGEEIYVNALDVPGLGFDGIATVGIARDPDHTSLFLMPTLLRTNPSKASALVTLSGETSDAAGHYPNFVALKYPLERILVDRPGLSIAGNVPVAKFASDGDAAAQARFGVPDFDKFVMIVMTNATYDSWRSRVQAAASTLDPRFRVYLGVTALSADTDSHGAEYTPFELVLRGFAYDQGAGHYTVRDMSTDPDLTNVTTKVRVYAHARP